MKYYEHHHYGPGFTVHSSPAKFCYYDINYYMKHAEDHMYSSCLYFCDEYEDGFYYEFCKQMNKTYEIT